MRPSSHNAYAPCTAAWVLSVGTLLAACETAQDRTGEADDDLRQALGLSVDEWAWAKQLAPVELPAPPEDVTNRFADDAEAADFGQVLFFDARLSGPLLEPDNNPDVNEGSLGYVGEAGKVSCASCHVAADDFVDTRSHSAQISLASGWVLRRTPTLLDAMQAKQLMWDGRSDTAFGQVFGAFESHLEMNSGRLFVAQQVLRHHRERYEAIFGALPPLDDSARFPQLAPEGAGCIKNDYYSSQEEPTCHGKPGDGAEYDGLSEADKVLVTQVVVNIGKAMGAYQRRLSCGPSRFDDWAHGDVAALEEDEREGFKLFVGKAGCVTCHNGPYFSDFAFHNVGLQPKTVATVFIDLDDPGAKQGFDELLASELSSVGPYSDGDDGRFPASSGDHLLGAFKTPTLRCVADRPSYMHTAHMASLEKVVSFFNAGGDAYGFLGVSELHSAPGQRVSLGLTDLEQAQLVRFLRALEGPGPAPALLQVP